MNNLKLDFRSFSSACSSLIMLLLAVVVVSCGGDDKVGSESMISGANSKTWRADKELNAKGEKQEVERAKEQEAIQFYADGRFALGSGGVLQTGTWSFDQAAKRLTLQFENENVTQNFEVMKLVDDEMRLKTPDGSEMHLKAAEQ